MRLRWKLGFIALVAFVLIGCAATAASISDYDACRNDPVCYAKMVQASGITKAVVDAVPLPGNGVVGMILSGLVSALAGIYYGRKVKKNG